MPYRMRALIACGLLLSTLPLLFKEYIPIPDYMRGLLAGFGLGLEITGLVFARRFQKTNGPYVCSSRSSVGPE